MTETIPKLSIIIANYQRPDHLERLLDALLRQTIPLSAWEVIVVDNCMEADERVRKLCHMDVYRPLDLHYIHYPVLGVSAARNRGVAASRADLVGFLDDDCLPPAEWIERVLDDYQETQAAIIGGPYFPFYMSSQPRWFRDEYVSGGYGDQARWMKDNETVAGGNMIWQRKLVEILGGFSTDFGPVGHKLTTGEETELHRRAKLAGVRAWYDPALVVQHCIHPERMSVRWLIRRAWLHAQSRAVISFVDLVTQDRRSRYRIIFSYTLAAVKETLRLMASWLVFPFRNRRHYPYWQNYVVEHIRPQIARIGSNLRLANLFAQGKRE